jgi:voltage-gated potassium channel
MTKTAETEDIVKREIESERGEILQQLEDWLEIPMLVLSFIWLALFVLEIIWGLSPFLETAGTVIWIIFWIDFLFKLVVAPVKIAYLKNNWITLLALALPALRIFRAFRAFSLLRVARTARGLRLVRLLTTLNRGMKALGASFRRRGFGYVSVLTLLVVFGGAAGMYGFENEVEQGFSSYSDALWWTAMLMTTMGSDYFPKTGEGRMLCVILAVYAFAVFGYVTATLATFFIQQDTQPKLDDEQVAFGELKHEISELRRLLSERLPQQ